MERGVRRGDGNAVRNVVLLRRDLGDPRRVRGIVKPGCRNDQRWTILDTSVLMFPLNLPDFPLEAVPVRISVWRFRAHRPRRTPFPEPLAQQRQEQTTLLPKWPRREGDSRMARIGRSGNTK